MTTRRHQYGKGRNALNWLGSWFAPKWAKLDRPVDAYGEKAYTIEQMRAAAARHEAKNPPRSGEALPFGVHHADQHTMTALRKRLGKAYVTWLSRLQREANDDPYLAMMIRRNITPHVQTKKNNAGYYEVSDSIPPQKLAAFINHINSTGALEQKKEEPEPGSSSGFAIPAPQDDYDQAGETRVVNKPRQQQLSRKGVRPRRYAQTSLFDQPKPDPIQDDTRWKRGPQGNPNYTSHPHWTTMNSLLWRAHNSWAVSSGLKDLIGGPHQLHLIHDRLGQLSSYHNGEVVKRFLQNSAEPESANPNSTERQHGPAIRNLARRGLMGDWSALHVLSDYLEENEVPVGVRLDSNGNWHDTHELIPILRQASYLGHALDKEYDKPTRAGKLIAGVTPWFLSQSHNKEVSDWEHKHQPTPQRKQYAAQKAPAGGLVHRGLYYPGGKFLPAPLAPLRKPRRKKPQQYSAELPRAAGPWRHEVDRHKYAQRQEAALSAMVHEVKSWLSELAQEVGEDPPQLEDEEIRKQLRAALGAGPARYSKDASGHEHKGKGEGGGQFTSSGDGGSSGGSSPHDDSAITKAGSRASRIIKAIGSSISGAVKAAVSKVTSKVGGFYSKLESQYGRKGAVAIMIASVALLPIPVPGTAYVPLLAAKAFSAVKSKLTGEPTTKAA